MFTLKPTLRFPDGAGDGVGGGAGTGQPAGSTQNAGTGQIDPALFLTKEEFGRTAAMIGGIKKALDGLTAGQLTLDRLTELGLLDKGEDGSYKPKLARKPDPKNPETEPWKAEIDGLKTQIRAKDDENARLKQSMENAERDRLLIAALTEKGALNAARDVVHLIGTVKKNGAGQWMGSGKDQYGVETEIDLGTAAEAFLKANPELKKAPPGGGSGTPAGGGTDNSGGTGGAKMIPKAQWQDMDWYAKNAEKFRAGEYVRGEK